MIRRASLGRAIALSFLVFCIGKVDAYVVPSYEDLAAMSDVIVVATPVENRDSALFSLAASPNQIPAVHVETKFLVLVALKGALPEKSFVFAHYRYADPEQSSRGGVLGPMPVAFTLGRRIRYLMFLKKREDGKWVSAVDRDTAIASKKLEDTIP